MIDLIYKTLLTIVNKENNGYVSPTEFNLLSDNVQSEIFRGYFEEENRDKNRENRGLVNKGYSNLPFNERQRITIFASTKTLAEEGGVSQDETRFGTYSLPSDIYFIEDDGISSVSTGVIVSEVERSRIKYLAKSEARPTLLYPVYVGFGGKIRVYPLGVEDIEISYLRKPIAPKWTFSVVTAVDGSTSELYDPASSSFQDFELHTSEFSNIVLRMLSFFGINLREGEVIKIAEILKDKMNLKDNG